MSTSTSTTKDDIKVRAIHDFDPKEMSSREKIELMNILKKEKEFMTVTEKAEDHVHCRPNDMRDVFEESTMSKFGELDCDRQISYRNEDDELRESGQNTHCKQSYLEDDMITLESKECNIIEKAFEGRKTIESREEENLPQQGNILKRKKSGRCKASELNFNTFRQVENEKSNHYEGFEKNQEEIIKIKELKVTIQKVQLTTDRESLRTSSGSAESSAKESDIDSSEEELEQEGMGTTSIESDESYHSENEVDPYAESLAFKRGDIMRTIRPANICDIVGWWMVRHLESGHTGFISRNHVVLEKDQEPSDTELNELPMELLDIILQNSFLHWTLNSTQYRKNEDVIKALASVNFFWFKRTTTQRFKRRIWQQQKEFYEKTTKISALIRNNQNYLLEMIESIEELLALLSSRNCITDTQRHIIQRQRSKRDKNAELLHIVRSFDKIKFSSFVKCLRQTKQKTEARIAENGGGVIKVDIHNRGGKCTTVLDTQLLHQKINDLRNRTKARSYQTEKHVSQLYMDGLEILGSQLDREMVVVWIWCHSQPAIERIKKLYDSNQLSEVIAGVVNIPSSTREIDQSKVINIDSNQFKKTVVVCPITVNFTERLDIGADEEVKGVINLRNEIYVLCRSLSFSSPIVIHVFEDRNPFPEKQKFKIKEIEQPKDIGSSQKDNCLYVAEDKRIWKMTRGTDDQYKIIKWLTTDYELEALSVSSDGQLMIANLSLSVIEVYSSDARLLHSVQLPRDIKEPRHAVETSFGNFIILHRCAEEKNGQNWSSGLVGETWGLCELTRNGQMVIRRFIPSNETQKLKDPRYLSLDSDDQVFVADHGNRRVILFDNDLRWNRIICPTQEEEKRIALTNRLCYNEEKKQLFVGRGGYLLGQKVHVYTLNRK